MPNLILKSVLLFNLQKPDRNDEKLKFRSEIFGDLFSASKLKCWESSETGSGKVLCESEPSSGGKRAFKVSEHFRNFA